MPTVVGVQKVLAHVVTQVLPLFFPVHHILMPYAQVASTTSFFLNSSAITVVPATLSSTTESGTTSSFTATHLLLCASYCLGAIAVTTFCFSYCLYL